MRGKGDAEDVQSEAGNDVVGWTAMSEASTTNGNDWKMAGRAMALLCLAALISVICTKVFDMDAILSTFMGVLTIFGIIFVYPMISAIAGSWMVYYKDP